MAIIKKRNITNEHIQGAADGACLDDISEALNMDGVSGLRTDRKCFTVK